MFARAPRVAARSSRIVSRRIHRGTRLQSNTSSPQTSQGGSSGGVSGSSAVAAGLAGGSLAFLAGYGWYHFSGAKSMVDTAHSTKSALDQAFKRTTENAPKPSEAIQWLRETVQSYAKLIPGAKQYVDQTFDDLEKVHDQHRDEVESIINETYKELKDVTKAGATWGAAIQASEVLQKALSRIGSLAKDAAGDIVDNHPELKEKLGGRVDQLKQMGKQYGPEAQKQVEEAWKQVQDIVKQGPLNPDSITKIQNLIQENVEKIKKYGDQAWQKGLEEAKPYLEKNPEIKEFVEKNPEIKEFVEKNKDKLLQGNLQELWKKIQKGDTEEIKNYVKEQAEKAGQKAQGGAGGASSTLSVIFGKVPGVEEVESKLKQLQELYQKRGHEAEDLIKSAVNDIKEVLNKKVEEGQKLKHKAEKDTKE